MVVREVQSGLERPSDLPSPDRLNGGLQQHPAHGWTGEEGANIARFVFLDRGDPARTWRSLSSATSSRSCVASSMGWPRQRPGAPSITDTLIDGAGRRRRAD
jgi:hypothetical protein